MLIKNVETESDQTFIMNLQKVKKKNTLKDITMTFYGTNDLVSLRRLCDEKKGIY